MSYASPEVTSSRKEPLTNQATRSITRSRIGTRTKGPGTILHLKALGVTSAGRLMKSGIALLLKELASIADE